jgi:glycosyltransferase involved in cell wall biosynthesis
MARAVIHIVTPEYPPAIGGVSDYAKQVARGLASAGQDVHVWCPGAGADALDDAVTVHRTLGSFRRADLERTGALLDRSARPRRLFVQWVPHAYGRRSMNVAFCVWIWRRAMKGDRIELMVHEPFLAFWTGTYRQAAAAAVHRVMTAILLQASGRVWVSIPAWERLLRPYTLGRHVRFAWLPIPTPLSAASPADAGEVRMRVGGGRPIVGHFGTFGSLITPALDELLSLVLARRPDACALMIGAGSSEYAARFSAKRADLAPRVHATGPLDRAELANHIAACDVLMQPYPDGVSSRRTTAMAGLFLEVPVVTTSGHLTESFWEHDRVAQLVPAGDWPALADRVTHLLGDRGARRHLTDHARAFYDRTFAVRHTVAALTAAT